MSKLEIHIDIMSTKKNLYSQTILETVEKTKLKGDEGESLV